MTRALLLALALLSSSSALYHSEPQAAASLPLTCRDYAVLGEAETGVPAALTLALGLYHEAGGNLSHPPAPCADGSFDLGAGFNSRWIGWYSKMFNGGVPIDPRQPQSLLCVARALAWNYETFGDWDMAMTAYRWGQTGARNHGVDSEYVAKVRAWI